MKRAFYEEMRATFGDKVAGIAYDVVSMVEGTPQVTNYDRCTFMDQSKRAGRDYTDASQTAGGNMAGVAGGSGNTSSITGVAYYEESVQQSITNSQLRDALIAGRKSLDGLQIDEDEKAWLLEQFEKLTAELKKESPKTTLLQRIWTGIAAFTSQAPVLLQLGKLLGDLFGVTTPAQTPTA